MTNSNKAGRNWNHILTYLDPRTRAYDDGVLVGKGTRFDFTRKDGAGEGGHTFDGDPKPEWTRCSTPRCEERREFTLAYQYVTGRAGRVSWSSRDLCRAHAEKAAEKYRLEIPTRELATHG